MYVIMCTKSNILNFKESQEQIKININLQMYISLPKQSQ